MFAPYISRWNLTPDGKPIITHSSQLLPVIYKDKAAILKIAIAEEEFRGALLMKWWNGTGAVRVLEHDGAALLMERIVGKQTLTQMVKEGHDNEASRIICDVAAKLHLTHDNSPASLVPLNRWFNALEIVASQEGGVLSQALSTADYLLASQIDIVVQHGDLHHGNILDGGSQGWLAIDPKGLMGERVFDFANIFCNPDANIAAHQGRLAQQARVVAEAAGVQHKRLLQWILAYSGLSAAWSISDNEDARLALTVAQIAAAEISNNYRDGI